MPQLRGHQQRVLKDHFISVDVDKNVLALRYCQFRVYLGSKLFTGQVPLILIDQAFGKRVDRAIQNAQFAYIGYLERIRFGPFLEQRNTTGLFPRYAFLANSYLGNAETQDMAARIPVIAAWLLSRFAVSGIEDAAIGDILDRIMVRKRVPITMLEHIRGRHQYQLVDRRGGTGT